MHLVERQPLAHVVEVEVVLSGHCRFYHLTNSYHVLLNCYYLRCCSRVIDLSLCPWNLLPTRPSGLQPLPCYALQRFFQWEDFYRFPVPDPLYR